MGPLTPALIEGKEVVLGASNCLLGLNFFGGDTPFTVPVQFSINLFKTEDAVKDYHDQ